MPSYWTLNTAEQRARFNEEIMRRQLAGLDCTVEFAKPESTITQRQVNAEHLWFRMVAETLAAAGIDMREAIRVPIPATEHLVKENLFKPVLKQMTGKSSTMDQNTIEPSAVAEVIAKAFAERYDIALPMWPDRYHNE